MDEDGVEALCRAIATIGAIYQWVDRVNDAGGVTCIAGVSAANAMIASLNKNRKRTDDLVMAPAIEAIRKMKEEN